MIWIRQNSGNGVGTALNCIERQILLADISEQNVAHAGAHTIEVDECVSDHTASGTMESIIALTLGSAVIITDSTEWDGMVGVVQEHAIAVVITVVGALLRRFHAHVILITIVTETIRIKGAFHSHAKLDFRTAGRVCIAQLADGSFNASTTGVGCRAARQSLQRITIIARGFRAIHSIDETVRGRYDLSDRDHILVQLRQQQTVGERGQKFCSGTGKGLYSSLVSDTVLGTENVCRRYRQGYIVAKGFQTLTNVCRNIGDGATSLQQIYRIRGKSRVSHHIQQWIVGDLIIPVVRLQIEAGIQSPAVIRTDNKYSANGW